MKIGIDANSLTRPFQHGTRRYTEELITALALVDKKNTYILFASKKVKIPKQKNFKLITIPKFPVLKRQVFLPIYIMKEKLDVFHNIDPFGSIFLKHPKMVTTVHDLDLGTVYPTFRNFKYFIKRCYSEVARFFILRNSKALIVVSKTTLRDLHVYIGKNIKQKFVKLIYEAPSSLFHKKTKEVKKNRFFLCMGDFSPRKNVKKIFESYSGLKSEYRRKYKLYIIISTKEETNRFMSLANTCSISKDIKIIRAPSDFEVRSLYQSAVCFIYPTIYEGFGLPILESMACGCPVITSNYGAMKEIAGTSAVLVDPKSTKEITKAILKTANNLQFRKSMISKGLKRAKRFSWVETARQTLSVYSSI